MDVRQSLGVVGYPAWRVPHRHESLGRGYRSIALLRMPNESHAQTPQRDGLPS